MRKLLLPVDGNAVRMRAAVAEAIQIYGGERVAIYLLSVQPAVSCHVAILFGDGELNQMQHDAGMEDLAPARALLDAAGVPYAVSVMVGRSAETIARAARELGCDRIVMGPESRGGIAGAIFGSLAAQVRQIVSGASDCQVIGS
jgi:nucleotide-binding universal stress UspA family protein